MPARTMQEAFEEARTLDAPLNGRLTVYASSVRTFNKAFADYRQRMEIDAVLAALKAAAAR